MVALRCASCGLNYRSGFESLFGFEAGSAVSIVDCVSSCPRCGSPNSIPSGVYVVIGGFLESLSDARASSGTIKQFFERLRTADVQSSAGAREFVEAVKNIEPKLEVAAQYTVKNWKILAIWLPLIIAFLSSCNFNVSLDVNRLVDQIITSAQAHEPERQSFQADSQDTGKKKKGSNTSAARSSSEEEGNEVSQAEPSESRQQRRSKERMRRKVTPDPRQP